MDGVERSGTPGDGGGGGGGGGGVDAREPRRGGASDGVLASGAGGLEKYAIAALFFIAGVGLPVGILKDAAGDVPLNAFTQSSYSSSRSRWRRWRCRSWYRPGG